MAAANNPNTNIELLDALRNHTEEYASHAKASFVQLAEVWQDLETNEQQQQAELQSVISAAQTTWTAAVQSARQQQQKVRDSIQQALAEMMEIKEMLGAEDPAAEAELARLQGSRSAHKTLRAWEQDVQVKAKYWQKQKLQRVTEYEDLQARIAVLRRLCGLAPVPTTDRPDISRANIDFLKLELERLAAEKVRREDLLRRLLDELHIVCKDIGEDDKAAAADVHPNLVYIWDEEAAKVMRDMYKMSTTYASSGSTGSMIDLSDSTISKLSSKVQAMKNLKDQRAAHAAEVLSVLHSLWDATDVPHEERSHFVKLMSGSLRLHARSLEKCMAEVRRLEDVRTQQMVDLVHAKGAELRALCADSHVAEPEGLAEALEVIGEEPRNPGAAAELLAKLLSMLAEMQVLAEKRSAIISAIREVEAARQEDEWLAEYEADEQRYKGRDANKKLQRAIRAGKLREKLPSMLVEVRRHLAEWRDSEEGPFLYDGQDYEFEVLDVLEAEVEEAAAQRAQKAARAASSRRQSNIGSSSIATGSSLLSPSKSVASRTGGAGMPPRPSSACGSVSGSPAGSSSSARRVDGPATPIPLRGVSSRTLQERHSICVVRSGREPVAGPAALSRSGEVRLPRTPSAATTGSSKTAKASPAAIAAAAAAGTRRAGTPASASATTPRSRTASLRTPNKQTTSITAAAGPGSLPDAGVQHTLAAAAVASGRDVRGSSSKQASTSLKLDNIFRRSSVQHPVAKLAGAADTQDARSPGSDGKRGRAGRVPPIGCDQALAADQDRDV